MKILTTLFLIGAMAVPAAANEETAQRFCRGELLEIGQTPGTPKKGECVVDPIAKTVTAVIVGAPQPSQENILAVGIFSAFLGAFAERMCTQIEEHLIAKHVFFDPGWRFIVQSDGLMLFRCNLPVKP